MDLARDLDRARGGAAPGGETRTCGTIRLILAMGLQIIPNLDPGGRP
jgi:hypothetical protein